MSTTIDERVVEMRFDNRHFEKNVSSTMSLLDKFKQKLNLSGASKGLDDINAATKKVDMTGLGRSVETVTAKFSALQVMGVTALTNITNSAVNAGKNIVKSLTIDPIMSGFSEYETKMGSIQTILANTQHAGTNLEDVTAALEELNLYADKTIYNFQEMTRNIGTFTAAGVDLDTSVKSIQGIANLAAVSGSTSQQASTAMYQLSQALSSGTVKLMDWNSVVNAGMGGKVFQDALIRTAAMLAGQAENVEAWKKANIDAHGSFRDSLSEGWITSEVLTKTLEQFTMAAEEGTDEWNKFKASLMESGYTESQAEEILQMANNASDAATKVKTFTQLLDTLKESAQSGWAQTWEIIIGDIEEAKEFFGTLSDLFGGIIGRSANNRNNLLSEAFGSNWDKLITKLKGAGIEATEFEERIRNILGNDALDGLIEKFGSLEKAVRAGAVPADVLKQALGGIAGTKAGDKIASFVAGLKEIERILGRGSVGDDVKKLQTALDALGYDLGAPGIDGIIGPITEKAIKEFQKEHGLLVDGIAGPETLAALEKAGTTLGDTTEGVEGLTDSYGELIDSITKKSGRELLLESVLNIIKAIHRPLAAVSEAFRRTFSVSPDQLYNVLEKIHGVTSSWVMEGVLDATNWETLTRKVNDLGIETSVFEDKLTSMLKKNGVNVDELIEKYGSLGKAFDAGAITLDTIKEVLLSFDGITESLLTGGDAADKVRRTFEGLFAVLEIIATIAGGAFRFAFKVLSKVLGSFGYSILDVTAGIGDALVAFRDWLFEGNIIAKLFDKLVSKIPVVVNHIKEWFKAFKETAAVQKFADAIRSISDAFKKFFSGEIDSTELARTLGTGLANALKAIPEMAIQVGKDFIAGFTNGMDFSITGVIKKIINFCLNFIEAFKEALGVHSPSWKAYEIVCDFFRGAINAIGDMLGGVIGAIRWVGEQIVKVFKSLWDFITDESGNIEWGKIFSAGILISMAWFLKQLATAFSGIAGFLGGLDDLIEGAKKVMKKFGKVLDGYAWDLKAAAVQKLAIAIAILVAALWVLTRIDDIGKLWNAVGVIAVLAGIVLGLAVAMDKLSGASATFDKENKRLKIDGMKKGLLQIGIALLLLVASVKMIGSMDPGALKQGLLGLGGIALGLIVFMAALGGISLYAKDIDKFGGTMIKLSIAMGLLVFVIKLISGLSPEQMAKGEDFAGKFAIFVGLLALASRVAGQDLDKIGGMMIKLSIALALMVGVCKLASKLTPEEMHKGAAFTAAFAILVAFLVGATTIAKDDKIAKIGGLVLSISFALLMMVGVCKLLENVSWGAMLKGGLLIAGFTVLIIMLIGACKIGNEQQMAKVSGAILAMSVAITILAAVAVALSFVPTDGLIKGGLVVLALGLLMKGMITALQGAQNVTGSLVAITIAIALLVGAVIALSIIDPNKLIGPVIAIGIVLGMFALVLNSSKNVTKSWGSLLAMSGIIAVLGAVLFLLGQLPWDRALAAAGALSVTMLAVSGAMQIISKIPKIDTGVIVSMSIALVAIGAVLFLLGQLPWDRALAAAGALSVTMLAIVGAMYIMSSIPKIDASIIGALLVMSAAMMVIGVVMTLLGAIGSNGVVTSLVAIGGALAILAIGLNVMHGTIAGSLALLVAAGALMVLTPALMQLSTLSWGQLLVGLAALAGVFVVLGLAGYILSPVAAVILALAASILMLGAAALMFGAGAVLLGVGIQLIADNFGNLANSVSTNGATFVAGMTTIITGLLALIPTVVTAVAQGILTFIQTVTTFLPVIAELVGKFIVTMLDTIAKYLPKIIKAGTDAIVAFIEGVTEALPRIIQAAYDLIIAFINGLADGIRNNSDRVMDAVWNLVTAIVGALFSAVGKTWKIAGDIMSKLWTGIKSGVGKVVSIVVDLGSKIVNGIKSIPGKFLEVGKNLAKGLVKGIKNIIPNAIQAVKDLGSKVLNAICKVLGIKSPSREFMEVGKYSVEGLAIGLTDNSYLATDASGLIGEDALEAFKRVFTDSNGSINLGDLFGSGTPDTAQVEAVQTALNTLLNTNLEVDGILGPKTKAAIEEFQELYNLEITGSMNDELITAIQDALKKRDEELKNIELEKTTLVLEQKLDIEARVVDDTRNLVLGDKYMSIQEMVLDSFESTITPEKAAEYAALPEEAKQAIAEELIQTIRDIYNSTEVGIDNGVTPLLEGAEEEYKAVLASRFDGLIPEARNSGTDVAAGFSTGVTKDGLPYAVKAADVFCNAFLNRVLYRFDIHSPSRVFRKIGAFIPAGFIQGVESLSNKVNNAADNMASGAINATSKAISRIADAVNADIDAQPTIRPVLDLSDVRAGAGSISSLLGGKSSVSLLANAGAINTMMNRRGQNGVNSELISAIDGLRKDLGNVGNTTYSINGITYDDGSNISETIKALVRQAKIERRV